LASSVAQQQDANRLDERAASAGPSGEQSNEARLRAIWERVLGVSPLRPDDNFFDVGGTSLVAVRLFQAIHDELGLDPPMSIMFEAQTTSAMAHALDRLADEGVARLMLLTPGTAEPPLFIVHGLAGDILDLRPLTLRLSTDRPVYGILAKGLDPREQPVTSVEEMAEEYIRHIREVQPKGPYALSGYSFGGLVAFEMARQLWESGEELEFLGLIDPYVDHRCLRPLTLRRWTYALTFTLRTRAPRFLRRHALRLLPRLPLAPPPVRDLPPVLREMEQICGHALAAYRPRACPVSAFFIRADERRTDLCDPLQVWFRVVAGGLYLEFVPGRHDEIVTEPGVQVLAERLAHYLDGRALGPVMTRSVG
jgi:acetoacetyl-CoA synthetase